MSAKDLLNLDPSDVGRGDGLLSASTERLQELYRHYVHKDTESHSHEYLVANIRRAVRNPPPSAEALALRRRRNNGNVPRGRLLVRLQHDTIRALDRVWFEGDYANRTDFMREAVAQLLEKHGDHDAAKKVRED